MAYRVEQLFVIWIYLDELRYDMIGGTWLTFALDLTRAEIDAHYLLFFFSHGIGSCQNHFTLKSGGSRGMKAVAYHPITFPTRASVSLKPISLPFSFPIDS